MSDNVFFDTNILVYAILDTGEKQKVAMNLLKAGGNVSIQAVNEFCNVARKKAKLEWSAITSIVSVIKNLVDIHPIGQDENDRAAVIANEYGFSFYDSLMAASAVRHDGDILYSEDLQHNQSVVTLTVINPFK